MSNFLSPFIKRIIYITCSLSYLATSYAQDLEASDRQQEARLGQQSNLSTIETKLAQLRTILATQVPLRLLAPILNEQSAIFTNESALTIEYKIKIKHIEFYAHIARMAIKNANQEDLLANIRTLRSLFMNLFNMRAGFLKYNKKLLEQSSSNNAKKALKLKSKAATLDSFLIKQLSMHENHVINAFAELTFKLSEDLFRPIFFSLYDWATTATSDNDYASKDRLLTFYRTTFK